MTLLFLPIVVPLAAAGLMLIQSPSNRYRSSAALIGSVLHLAAALALLLLVRREGLVSVQVGNWPAPFGITLVADLLSAALVVITALMGLAVVVYAFPATTMSAGQGRTPAFVQVLLAAISGAFLTGDLFNLYVWFEVMLMASFALMSGGRGWRKVQGMTAYVVINLLATLCFLLAIGLLYGMTGTLNLAHLHLQLGALPTDANATVAAVAMLLIFAFGIKAAIFPLYYWLPAAYPHLPIHTAALFAGLLTKVGVYSLLRVTTLLFAGHQALLLPLLLGSAALTMLLGVLGAAAQTDIRRILSYHIISQVGYMVLGIALFTPLALAATIVYLLHHIVVKTNLFLIAGLVQRLGGAYGLGHLGGLYARSGWLTAGFLVAALSLAGVPPLSGFWAKLLVIRSALAADHLLLAVLALAVGFLTLYSMTKIWQAAFWTPAATPPAPAQQGATLWMGLPVALLATITICFGLGIEPIFDFARQAAEQLVNPQIYVNTVLGG
ncbi:MAG: proton-conducting transporter membrane subunit [Desulfosarcinaceae bacterium]